MLSTTALTLRPAALFARVRIYVLITEAFCRAHWLATAEQAKADCPVSRALGAVGAGAGARLRKSVLGDICEAVIGAIYLDGGYAAASQFVERNWTERNNMPAWGIIDTPGDAMTFSMYISEHYRWPTNRLRRLTVQTRPVPTESWGWDGRDQTSDTELTVLPPYAWR